MKALMKAAKTVANLADPKEYLMEYQKEDRLVLMMEANLADQKEYLMEYQRGDHSALMTEILKDPKMVNYFEKPKVSEKTHMNAIH